MQFDSDHYDDLTDNHHDHGAGSLLLSRTRVQLRLSGLKCLLRGHRWSLPRGEQLCSRSMQRHDHYVDNNFHHYHDDYDDNDHHNHNDNYHDNHNRLSLSLHRVRLCYW